MKLWASPTWAGIQEEGAQHPACLEICPTLASPKSRLLLLTGSHSCLADKLESWIGRNGAVRALHLGTLCDTPYERETAFHGGRRRGETYAKRCHTPVHYKDCNMTTATNSLGWMSAATHVWQWASYLTSCLRKTSHGVRFALLHSESKRPQQYALRVDLRAVCTAGIVACFTMINRADKACTRERVSFRIPGVARCHSFPRWIKVSLIHAAVWFGVRPQNRRLSEVARWF